jgi:hypothetical protein
LNPKIAQHVTLPRGHKNKQWPLAHHLPDSLNTRSNLARIGTFFQKWHFANVGESGESSQNGLVSVGKSGEP